MGGATAESCGKTANVAVGHLSSQLVDDMCAHALPADTQDFFSVCSDPTSESGKGLGVNLNCSRPRKNRLSIHEDRNQIEHPGELVPNDDSETISTCSLDDSNQGAANAPLSAQRYKRQTTGGLLDTLDDDDDCSFDLEDGGDGDVTDNDGAPFRRASASLASSTNANTVSKAAHNKMHDSHLLLLEAALACREGTAWCTKSLAQEALEQSFSHLSRVSCTQW
jgi:hypothetical protein